MLVTNLTGFFRVWTVTKAGRQSILEQREVFAMLAQAVVFLCAICSRHWSFEGCEIEAYRLYYRRIICTAAR